MRSPYKVTRPGGVRPRSVGWSTRVGGLVWVHPGGRVDGPGRARWVRLLRRTHRGGNLVVLAHTPHVRTARSVGVRMGKGKGRPAGAYGWAPTGTPLAQGGVFTRGVPGSSPRHW